VVRREPNIEDRRPTAGRTRVVSHWVIAAVVVAHGLLHLLGAAKGLGWAEVTQLRQPISTPMGWAWLGAAALMVLASILARSDLDRIGLVQRIGDEHLSPTRSTAVAALRPWQAERQ